MASSYENTRLILAIDYGTTFSGISYAESTANDPRDIHIWTKYPGIRQREAENSCKAPSVIALPKENEAFGLEEAAWGYEIEPGMKTYSWTKFLLDDDTKRTKYDDPKIDQFFGAGMQELPSGYEASDLVKEYLQGMHKVVWSWLQRSFGKAQLDYMPIDVWVTVPAVWSERAKHLTRNAAYEAGFATRAGDTIKVIAEPAAAAHITIPTTLKESPGKIKENEGLLVCDAGGGTVDITTYIIQKIRPRLVLDEIVVGAGGKCGGSFIDRNLNDLLIERFGDSYTSVSKEERGPGSNFMNIFEGFKRGFSSSTAVKKPTRLRLELPAITNDPNLEAQHKEHYSTKTKSILLSHHDWKRIFDPVVKKVINLVRDQVADAKNVRPIKVLILVGGFGESEYLSERLKRFCRENDIWLTSPSEGAWSAVVRGAVLRGLEDDIVRRSRSRRHYGIIVTEAYVPYKHDHIPQDGQDVFLYTDPETEELRMSGMTLWTIPRGQVMLPDSDFNVSIYKSFSLNSKKDTKFAVHLYACGEASPPIAYDESKIEPVGEQVSCSFENIDWDSTIKRAPSGKDYYHVDLIVQLRPADKLGLMTMKILHVGVMVGKGELEVR